MNIAYYYFIFTFCNFKDCFHQWKVICHLLVCFDRYTIFKESLLCSNIIIPAPGERRQQAPFSAHLLQHLRTGRYNLSIMCYIICPWYQVVIIQLLSYHGYLQKSFLMSLFSWVSLSRLRCNESIASRASVSRPITIAFYSTKYVVYTLISNIYVQWRFIVYSVLMYSMNMVFDVGNWILKEPNWKENIYDELNPNHMVVFNSEVLLKSFEKI